VGNLGFAFLAFVVYFNLLVLGKSWIQSGQVNIGVFLFGLHGGALALALLWLTKRHNNWALRLRRGAPKAPPAEEPAA
jgi:lipopolysaccharide export system permease protein